MRIKPLDKMVFNCAGAYAVMDFKAGDLKTSYKGYVARMVEKYHGIYGTISRLDSYRILKRGSFQSYESAVNYATQVALRYTRRLCFTILVESERGKQ